MQFDYKEIKQWPIGEAIQSYTARDTILYALGVGAATSNPVTPEDLKFVYEDGLQALPTLHAVLGAGESWMDDPATGIRPTWAY